MKNFKTSSKASVIHLIRIELDKALESILDRMKFCEEEFTQFEKDSQAMDAQDKDSAEDLRKKAMETFREPKQKNN